MANLDGKTHIFSLSTFESIKDGGDKNKFYPQIVHKLFEIVDNFVDISTIIKKILKITSYPHLKRVEYALSGKSRQANPPGPTFESPLIQKTVKPRFY